MTNDSKPGEWEHETYNALERISKHPPELPGAEHAAQASETPEIEKENALSSTVLRDAFEKITEIDDAVFCYRLA
ncbi:MAG: hypothetical protein AAF355_01605 [Myxococcota bacterium]